MPNSIYVRLKLNELKVILIQKYFNDITLAILNTMQDPQLLNNTLEEFNNKMLNELEKVETKLLKEMLSPTEFSSIKTLLKLSIDYADQKVDKKALLAITACFGKYAITIIEEYDIMIKRTQMLEDLLKSKIPKPTNSLFQYHTYKYKAHHIKIGLLVGAATMVLAFALNTFNKQSLNPY